MKGKNLWIVERSLQEHHRESASRNCSDESEARSNEQMKNAEKRELIDFGKHRRNNMRKTAAFLALVPIAVLSVGCSTAENSNSNSNANSMVTSSPSPTASPANANTQPNMNMGNDNKHGNMNMGNHNMNAKPKRTP